MSNNDKLAVINEDGSFEEPAVEVYLKSLFRTAGFMTQEDMDDLDNEIEATQDELDALEASITLTYVAKPPTGFAVRYVSTVGNDSNDGLSPSSAKATIQAAIDAIEAAGLLGVVRVGSGVFTGYVKLKNGISVVGNGSFNSTIKAPVGGSPLGVVTINTGPISGANLVGFRIEGSGNAGQHGLFAEAVGQVTAPFHGGWWYSELRDIEVVNVLGRPIWLCGGGSDFLKPHQFLEFHLVRAFTSKASNKEAILISGQVGQINFHGCEFDSNETAPYGAVMTVPNIHITKQMNSSGAFVSSIVPYALTFHTVTIQGGWKAMVAQYGAAGISFVNPHLEGFKFGFHVLDSADVVLHSPSFSNVGNGDGTGWLGKVEIGRLTVHSPTVGGTHDKTWVSSGEVLSTIIADTWQYSIGTETTGISKQLGISGSGVVDMGANRTAIVNGSTTITNIKAAITPGQPIFIKAFSGSLTFAEGSGIHLAGTSPMTVPSGATAQFVFMDILAAWCFVGKSF